MASNDDSEFTIVAQITDAIDTFGSSTSDFGATVNDLFGFDAASVAALITVAEGPVTIANFGARNDLPPVQSLSSSAVPPSAASININGTQAVISKKSRTSKDRIGHFFIPEEFKPALEKYVNTFGPIEQQEFKNMFKLSGNSAYASSRPSALSLPIDLPLASTAFAEIGNSTGAFVKFILMSVSENFQEKAQIVEVLQDNYIPYFYGSRPATIQLSGVILNSVHDQWKYWFLYAYHKLFKPSKLSELAGQPALGLWYDDTRITGYPLNLSLSQNSEFDTNIQFSMQILVKTYDIQLLDQDDWTKDLNREPFLFEAPFSADGIAAGKDDAGFFGLETGNPLIDKMLEASEDFVVDTVNDATRELGIDAAGQALNNILAGNLNPANLVTNFVNDPIGTIQQTRNDVTSAKNDIIFAQSTIKSARANKSETFEEILSDNVVIGPARATVRDISSI